MIFYPLLHQLRIQFFLKDSYPGVDEIRSKSLIDLDAGVLECLNHNIKYLIDTDAFIDPLTLRARNYLIKEKNGKA